MNGISNLIGRERIHRRIESAAICPVVLIHAPGGFGKSAALEQYLAGVSVRKVRCTVVPADDTLHAFVSRLVGALAIDSALLETVEEALARPETSARELALLLAHGLADLDGIVAVDDFHYATAENASEFLTALVDATVPRLRWIIASRSHKGLPVAEWIARGACAPPITSDELALTLEEATMTTKVLVGICPENDIQKILELRGFPLAFFLAVRFASAGAAASRVIGQARELSYDYLARHVYDLLSADERRHLQFGALLRTFDCELFEQAGFSSARRVLKGLYRQGSFLVASDQPDLYLCNDVFLDFLEDQLRSCSGEEQRALRRIAADVLSDLDRDSEATMLYAEAQEYGALLGILRRRGFELISEGHRELIRNLLGCIPRQLRNASPIAIALEAWLIGHEERYAQAEALFLKALELSSDAQERLSISFQFALYQMVTKVGDAAQRFSAIADTPGVNPTMRISALGSALLLRSWLDPFLDVDKDLDEIEPLIASCERDFDRTDAILDAGITAMYAGNDRALALLTRAKDAAERKGFLSQLCSVYQRLALFALYCDGDINAARRYAESRKQVAQQLTGTRLRRGGLVLNMLIALRAGDSGRAHELLAEHAELPETDDASVSATVNRVRAMLAAWDGDYERAYKLLRPILPFVFPFYRPIAQALCALMGSAAGLDVADSIEDQLSVLRASKPRFARGIEREHTVRALLSIALTISGRNSSAKRLLTSWRGKSSRIPFLLREVGQLLADDSNGGYASASVLEQLSQVGCNDLRLFLAPLFRRRQPRLEEKAPTQAEIAVLRLLEQGLSPKEIAEMRDTSVHTIRKQLQNLRTKLGRQGTDQILARAHALGLLSKRA